MDGGVVVLTAGGAVTDGRAVTGDDDDDSDLLNCWPHQTNHSTRPVNRNRGGRDSWLVNSLF